MILEIKTELESLELLLGELDTIKNAEIKFPTVDDKSDMFSHRKGNNYKLDFKDWTTLIVSLASVVTSVTALVTALITYLKEKKKIKPSSSIESINIIINKTVILIKDDSKIDELVKEILECADSK